VKHDPEDLDETAARMARVLGDEDWPILDEDRKNLWRSLTDEATSALMLPQGPKREAALGRLMKKIEKAT